MIRAGEWEIASVEAGRFALDGGAMFGVVPRTMWAQRLAPDDANRIPMAMRLLLARGHGRTILVDAGAGTGYDEKMRSIYAFDEMVGLDEYLRRAGVDPDAITDVVLTHLHFDHAAGVAAPDGDDWRLVLPRARHHVQRAQWEHALAPNPRDRASYFVHRLRAMEAAGVLELHDGPWSPAPGFELDVVHGHTPAQQLPRIGSGPQTVVFAGDLIPTQHHLPLPWVMAYDLDPVRAMEEKRALLERVVAEGWVLFFEHDAHLEAARVAPEGRRIAVSEAVSVGPVA